MLDTDVYGISVRKIKRQSKTKRTSDSKRSSMGGRSSVEKISSKVGRSTEGNRSSERQQSSGNKELSDEPCVSGDQQPLYGKWSADEIIDQYKASEQFAAYRAEINPPEKVYNLVGQEDFLLTELHGNGIYSPDIPEASDLQTTDAEVNQNVPTG